MSAITEIYKERSKCLLGTDALSDVKFVVRASIDGETSSAGKKVIPAHRFLLAIASPVFFAMFCGSLAAETSKNIHLPDCDYEGMLEFLRFIYTGEVRFNGSNVLQLLYLAEKYMIESLTKRCILFLRDHLDSSNVFCVLKHSKLIENKSLLRSCWKFIDKECKDVLESEEFLEVDKMDLIELVKRDTLNIKEIDLFVAINRWAENECKKLKYEAHGKQRRQILGEQILKNLRYPVMEENEFCDIVCNTELLSLSETRELLNYFSERSLPVRFMQTVRQYDPSTERRFLYHRGQIWDIFD